MINVATQHWIAIAFFQNLTQKKLNFNKKGHLWKVTAYNILKSLSKKYQYIVLMVAGSGFEPLTFGLWARRASELLYPAILKIHYILYIRKRHLSIACQIFFVIRRKILSFFIVSVVEKSNQVKILKMVENFYVINFP